MILIYIFFNKNKDDDNLNEDADSSQADVNVNYGKGLKAIFFNCLYTNLTTLYNKMYELQACLEFEDFPHLIFITETWFKPETVRQTERRCSYLRAFRPHFDRSY